MVRMETLRKGNGVTEYCKLITLFVIQHKIVKEILTLMPVSVRRKIH